MALEANGITVFIPDEYTAGNALYQPDPSGVRVQVAEEDAETARQVISVELAKAGSLIQS